MKRISEDRHGKKSDAEKIRSDFQETQAKLRDLRTDIEKNRSPISLTEGLWADMAFESRESDWKIESPIDYFDRIVDVVERYRDSKIDAMISAGHARLKTAYFSLVDRVSDLKPYGRKEFEERARLKEYLERLRKDGRFAPTREEADKLRELFEDARNALSIQENSQEYETLRRAYSTLAKIPTETETLISNEWHKGILADDENRLKVVLGIWDEGRRTLETRLPLSDKGAITLEKAREIRNSRMEFVQSRKFLIEHANLWFQYLAGSEPNYVEMDNPQWIRAMLLIIQSRFGLESLKKDESEDAIEKELALPIYFWDGGEFFKPRRFSHLETQFVIHLRRYGRLQSDRHRLAKGLRR